MKVTQPKMKKSHYWIKKKEALKMTTVEYVAKFIRINCYKTELSK